MEAASERSQKLMSLKRMLCTADTADTPARKQHKVAVQDHSYSHTSRATANIASHNQRYEDAAKVFNAVNYANPAQTIDVTNVDVHDRLLLGNFVQPVLLLDRVGDILVKSASRL
jgi:hypothetical protein